MKRSRRRRRFGHYGTRRGAEHAREREEQAEVNIPPDLLPLWRRTRRQFRGTPHQRYEQFMQYAHDSGEREAMGALQDDADAKLERALIQREANDAQSADRYSEAGRTLAELRWGVSFP